MRSPPAVTLIKGELFKQGGLEKYTWQMAKSFCELGCPVTLLTSGRAAPPFSHSLLHVESFRIDHPASFLNVIHFDRACSAYLKKNPTPIIFSLDRTRYPTHLRAGNGAHAAYLQRRSAEEGFAKKVSFAINPLHRVILSLEKKSFEHPDLKVLFANSHMVKQEILQLYRTDPKKIEVVHNGVEWHALQESFDVWEGQRDKTLQELNLDPKAFQFLFVGHNFLRKGLGNLLHALAHIKNESFQLSIVGCDKNASSFQHLAQDLGLSKKVFFFGTKQTASFYQLADCLVIPSLYDPFANVTVEALAFGLYVISSSSNGGHEILTELNGAVLESLEDPISFSRTLLKALNYPKTAKSAKIIRNSVQHLDFSHQLQRITQLTLI